VRCYGPGQPGNELCNGLDDDCDGIVDDNLVDCPGMPPMATCCKSNPPACSVLNDALNCGACGMTCNLANAQAACVAQACAIATCNMGYTDCDRMVSDGCEVNTGGDVNNCGSCGRRCNTPSNASSVGCTTGACVVTGCNGTHADCNGSFSDGCEVDTNNNIANCGKCGMACSVANGTPACMNGRCAIAMCMSSYGDCNNMYSDGCETDVTSDPNHCGNCTMKCMVANGTPACVSKMCQIGSCNTNWGDCDLSYGNGCETNTSSDVSNCGACNNDCNAAGKHYGDGCASGSCTCNGGPACDGSTNWCAGGGGCLLANGQTCTGNAQCWSNNCKNGSNRYCQ
jgi:hypothetical protein